MMTRRDPWTNILRSAIGCFAAAAGGAQSITVAPFDSALGQSDSFARRIARNTHAVIRDEASLARVADPAAGSWYVETLTEQLAEAAWTKFTALESAGGASAAVESGALSDLLRATRDARHRNISTRRDPITGVSVFPPMVEDLVLREPAPPAPPGGALPAIRYAQDFEALRDRSDAHAQNTGERPRVVLAALGSAAAYGARVDFARDVFGIAGIESVVVTGDADALVAAFAGANTPLACLCSSDAIYADEAPSATESLRAAGAQRILLAGKPSGAPVLDGYLFVGSDVLELLQNALGFLGVA